MVTYPNHPQPPTSPRLSDSTAYQLVQIYSHPL